MFIFMSYWDSFFLNVTAQCIFRCTSLRVPFIYMFCLGSQTIYQYTGILIILQDRNRCRISAWSFMAETLLLYRSLWDSLHHVFTSLCFPRSLILPHASKNQSLAHPRSPTYSRCTRVSPSARTVWRVVMSVCCWDGRERSERVWHNSDKDKTNTVGETEIRKRQPREKSVKWQKADVKEDGEEGWAKQGGKEWGWHAYTY